ncbi:hypothetical protein GCM10011506_03250 [Marivirga lumbricoides]|uniref:Lipocalin-like domain-containing protein n=1 Tax=Marivirga lumbricoides TaxID=1046115 RepID=A0ABQ1LAT1_9BACT|nr:hypothetical protein GCM10011506_03250 [Marivirga lumbricoides]
MKNWIYTLLPVIFLFSCEYKNNKPDKEEFFGSWIYDTDDEQIEKYVKSDTLSMNNFGLNFKPDNTLERVQLIGGCATPPLEFEKVTGIWSQTSDSTILIKYNDWRGSIKDHYWIKNINNNQLSLKLIDYQRTKR